MYIIYVVILMSVSGCMPLWFTGGEMKRPYAHILYVVTDVSASYSNIKGH